MKNCTARNFAHLNKSEWAEFLIELVISIESNVVDKTSLSFGIITLKAHRICDDDDDDGSINNNNNTDTLFNSLTADLNGMFH